MAGMAELGLGYEQQNPTFKERYPEGRDRLLALAERPTSSGSPPVSSRPPRMGLRDVRSSSSNKQRPLSQGRNLARPSPIYASEQSLPDKLSQALKGLSSSLRPSSQNSAGSSFGRQSGGSVAADDVIYYPSGNVSNRSGSSVTRQTEQTDFDEASDCALMPPRSPPPPIPPKFNHGLNLDDLRQMYKSAPDFEHLNGIEECNSSYDGADCSPPTANVEKINAPSVKRNQSPIESHYANIDELRLLRPVKPASGNTSNVAMNLEGGNSPTDSGYRSVPRQVYPECLSTFSPGKATVVVIEGSTPSPPHPKSGEVLNKRANELNNYASSDRSYPSTTQSSEDGLSRKKTPQKLHIDHSPNKPEMNQRNASFDTINTNVSLPEEFSLERCPKLVELERIPWNEKDVITVLQRGRTKETVHRIAVDVVPRLTYLLQRPLIRIARQLQRFGARFSKCSKQDVISAVKVILPECLVESCLKAGIQATSLYAMSGKESLKQSKSRRAGLKFSVGKFHRWLCDAQICPCVHEQASVFLTAVCECLLEELILQCLPGLRSSSASGHRSSPSPDSNLDDSMLTSDSLDLSLVGNADFWGLLQPYEHLISSRTANGVLCLPNSLTVAAPSSKARRHGLCGSESSSKVKTNGTIVKNLEQCFLATCVGSVPELGELIGRVIQHQLSTSCSSVNSISSSGSPGSPKYSWSLEALQTLYYYMRCSQLEGSNSYCSPSVILAHERPYLVLPPLVDWLRVSQAYCEHRQGTTIDAEDVCQGARLLLPSLDCPPRLYRCPEPNQVSSSVSSQICAQRFKQALAFRMLETGRGDLIPQAIALLGPLKLNTPNENGLTALMLACLKGDEPGVHALLDSGADVNCSMLTSVDTDRVPNLIHDLCGWTPLCFAVAQRNLPLTQTLIERCADVENSNMVTETPLQLAVMSGNYDIATRLLACGADPFRSTLQTSTEGYGFKQRGLPSSLSLAASYGHRSLLQLMLTRGQRGRSEEVLSLEDFLAEGNSPTRTHNRRDSASDTSNHSSPHDNNLLPGLKLTKPQQKSLQEAMYHASECGHLDITMDLRNLGIAWNTHIWTQTLATAHELRRKALVQLLLADFTSRERRLLDDISHEFIDDGLPLLFDIFRHSKNDVTSGQLASILSQLYGVDPPILELNDKRLINGENNRGRSSIDKKFVNNPELSDVQFTVEGKVFYGHRIVLVNASDKFREILLNNNTKDNNKTGEPIEVKDVAYDVFELMMEYLYGNSLAENGPIALPELLQLLSVARQFSVDSLAVHCELRISKLIDLENCLEIYKFATRQGAATLCSYCEGYFLQNLPQLLTESPISENFRKTLCYSGRHGKHIDLSTGLVNTLSRKLESRLNTGKR